jgi:hypothetical protein
VKSTGELFDWCAHWNQAMAAAAAAELGRRGLSIFDLVVENASHADPAIRAASAQVVAGMLGKLRSSPIESDFREFMVEKYPVLVATLTALIRDGDIRVRRNAIAAYNAVGPTSRGVPVDLDPMIHAAVQQAVVEHDGHLCQEIIISTSRNRWFARLPEETRVDLLSALLLQQPFPRGRGTVVAEISKLSPQEIQLALPALLAHFRTPLLRDTMFFPGGAPQAFVLIAEHRKSAPQLFKKALAHVDTFNRQAWVSFAGKRGLQLHDYWECLAGLGKQAAVALPSLERLLLQQEGEAADYAQTVIERIRQ